MKIGMFPMKTGQGTRGCINFYKDKNNRLGSMTEMDNGTRTYIGLLKDILGPKWAVLTKDHGEHSQECPGSYRPAPWFKVVDFTVTKLSDDVPGKGAGNDRWLSRLEYKLWRSAYVIYWTHLNAEVQRVLKDGAIVHGPRWDAYKVEIQKIETALSRDIADPKIKGVIFQGDVNMLPKGEGMTNPSSPYQMFKRLKMEWVNTRVIVQAVSHSMRFHRTTIFPPKENGWPSDHGAILSDIRKR